MPLFNRHKRQLVSLNKSRSKPKLEEKEKNNIDGGVVSHADMPEDYDGNSSGDDNDNDNDSVSDAESLDIDDNEEDFYQDPSTSSSSIASLLVSNDAPDIPSTKFYANFHRPFEYSGLSLRTQRRKRQLLQTTASAGHSPITSFFSSNAKPVPIPPPALTPEPNILPLEVAINLINDLPFLQNNQKNVKYPKNSNIPFEVTRAKAVRAYLYEWQEHGDKFLQVRASESIASHYWSESFYHPSASSSISVSYANRRWKTKRY